MDNTANTSLPSKRWRNANCCSAFRVKAKPLELSSFKTSSKHSLNNSSAILLCSTRQVTLKWTYLIWLTDLSLSNQHYHAAPIRKLRSWANRFFKIVGFACKRFLRSLPLPVTHFSALAPIFARLKNEKCLERAENLTETLAPQANFVHTIKLFICSTILFQFSKAVIKLLNFI